jgi:hypothetical protein
VTGFSSEFQVVVLSFPSKIVKLILISVGISGKIVVVLMYNRDFGSEFGIAAHSKGVV